MKFIAEDGSNIAVSLNSFNELVIICSSPKMVDEVRSVIVRWGDKERVFEELEVDDMYDEEYDV